MTKNERKLLVYREIIKSNPDITADEYEALSVSGKPGRPWLRKVLDPEWRTGKIKILGDIEVVIEAVKQAKRAQQFMDKNRIQNKTFREYARVENALTDLNSELVSLLREYGLTTYTQSHKQTASATEPVAIFHFTDPHFNELVDLPFNKYDFKEASKRCQKLVQSAKKYFSNAGVKRVVFAMTGDMLNSDRRSDEILNMATNRSKAMILAIEIIRNMILDLNELFNVSILCVSGNESRVKDEWGWSDIVVTDNYDYSIYSVLELLFENSKGIEFIGGDSAEIVVNIKGNNFLFVHGNGMGKNLETAVQQTKGRYAGRGIEIAYIISGHLHSARIGDNYARGSSLVGANDYSEKGLNLSGRASQNLHVIYGKNCDMDGIRVDVQNTGGFVGYDIDIKLEAYNAKSAKKLREPKLWRL